MTIDEKIKFEDEVDMQFIQRVQAEVTQSCALPFAVPVERIPAFIVQAAQWFWLNSDLCSEERMYVVRNEDICKGNGMNKIVTDVESGLKRVRDIATPPNTVRLNKKTPCAITGKCEDCYSPDCICGQIVVTRRSGVPNRIKIILIGEELGY